jgi:hypothetical protein
MYACYYVKIYFNSIYIYITRELIRLGRRSLHLINIVTCRPKAGIVMSK